MYCAGWGASLADADEYKLPFSEIYFTRPWEALVPCVRVAVRQLDEWGEKGMYGRFIRLGASISLYFRVELNAKSPYPAGVRLG